MRHYCQCALDTVSGGLRTKQHERVRFSACGTSVMNIEDMFMIVPEGIDYEECLASQVYKDDLIQYEIGFETNLDAWRRREL